MDVGTDGRRDRQMLTIPMSPPDFVGGGNKLHPLSPVTLKYE